MVLTVDIGNTNIVLGCIENGDIIKEVRIATDVLKTSDQYCAELKNMLDLMEMDPSLVEGCIISSVVPPVLNSFRTAVIKLTGKQPIPVWHISRGKDEFIRHCDEFPYVALGGYVAAIKASDPRQKAYVKAYQKLCLLILLLLHRIR